LVSMAATLVVGAYAFYRQVVRWQDLEIQRRSLVQQSELGEMKLRFFSMVSHEFRTPLSVILGSTQLLLEGNERLGEKPMNNLRRIQSASRSMKQLLSDTLMLTRAEAGKLEYQPERLELVSFCLNLIEDFQVDPKFAHDICFENRATLINASLDEKLIYSILSNLLGNSIKYSPPGSVIQFVLAGDIQRVEFIIQDQGIGIPAADQAFLYEPFYRGTNSQGSAGTGLGLAVVKKCVELHGGTIAVKSEEAVGTTFWVKIPLKSSGAVV
jgi:signal transduction histidine kinase